MAATQKRDIAQKPLDEDKTQVAALLAALQWLDRRLEHAVSTAQAVYGSDAADDPYRGLYIGSDEPTRLLARPPGVSPLFSEKGEQLQLAADGSRLAHLVHTFDLSSFEVVLLLLGLAPEIDLRYQRLYAFLQDDVTKLWPGVNLAMNLFCATLEDRLAARRCFDPDAPLLHQRLLRLFDDPAQVQPPLLSRYLKVDEGVVGYLLGSVELDARLAPFVHMLVPQVRLTDLLLPGDTRDRLVALAHAHIARPTALILYFQGAYGAGKQRTAEAFCYEVKSRVLVVQGERLARIDPDVFIGMVRWLVRDARLGNMAIYWDGFDALLSDDRSASREALLLALQETAQVAFLAGNSIWEPAGVVRTLPFVRVRLSLPDATERSRIWAQTLADTAQPDLPAATDAANAVTHTALSELATKFRLSAGQIADATATAQNLAHWRDPENRHVIMSDLYAACRLQSNRKLGELARKITPHYTWNDIILPADRLQQLREICNYVAHRACVYETWGFDRKLALGKGLNVLFAGSSGTGKTMAAGIMAGELGLELYKIDLSTVVSKYIGETEKNLAQIFTEAESSNAILFFDEADALFGKRSEVKDAHDRYANIEIGYLLQRMEEYEGITILATNLRKNMDEAFVRRIHFIVEFPFPSSVYRRQIWEQIWPADTPRSADLDLEFIAQRCEIAGGSIRNIALAAAFLAASDGQVVNMQHLVHATKREYQKLGRVVSEGEFGEYARQAK